MYTSLYFHSNNVAKLPDISVNCSDKPCRNGNSIVLTCFAIQITYVFFFTEQIWFSEKLYLKLSKLCLLIFK